MLQNDRKLVQQTSVLFDGLYESLGKQAQKKRGAKTAGKRVRKRKLRT